MSSPDEIFHAVQSLAPDERWQLITRLWDALPPEDWPKPPDEDLAEVHRRFAEYEAGEVESISWEDARKQIRERLAGNG
jgi:putative addiction module component (TIGR02574 family)